MAEHLVILYCCMAPGCDKVYNTKFNLKRHVNSHHVKTRRYVCSICERHFSSNQNLIEHRNLHSGKKPFTCQLCKQRFRQASQLSLHKRIHRVDGDLEGREEEVGQEGGGNKP